MIGLFLGLVLTGTHERQAPIPARTGGVSLCVATVRTIGACTAFPAWPPARTELFDQRSGAWRWSVGLASHALALPGWPVGPIDVYAI